MQVAMTARRTFLLLSSFLICRLATGQDQPDCSESRFNECKEILNRPHHFEANGPFFSQEQIQRGCSALLQADQCVSDMLQSCPDLQDDARPTVQPENVKQIRSCRILVTRYVQKLGCFEAMNETYQRCLEHEKDSFSKHIQNILNGNRELQEDGCCNIQQMFGCMLKPTAEKCDEDASDILSDYLNTTLPDGAMDICITFRCAVPDSSSADDIEGHEHHHHEDNEHKHQPKNTIDHTPGGNVASSQHVQIVMFVLSLIISVKVVSS